MSIVKPSSELMDFVATQVLPVGKSSEWLETAKQALRKKARKSFQWFLRWCCEFEDVESPFHTEYIQRWDARRHFPYTITLAPRKHLKTTVSVIGDSLYEGIQEPTPSRGVTYTGANARQLIFTATLDLGVDMLTEMKGIIETSQMFRFLYPEYCYDLAPRHIRDRCRYRQAEFDWPCRTLWKKEPSISVAAVDASRTSQHYDMKRHDDVQNETNVDNRPMRDSGHGRFLNSWQLRHDPVYSRTRLTATRWHYDDIPGREIAKEYAQREAQRLRGEKVRPRCLIYIRRLVEDGKPIWPERFPLSACNDLREHLGSYIFGCQYMNDPVSPENAVFKREDIRWAWESDLAGKPLVTFAALDLAVDDKQSSDYTAIAVCSVDDSGKTYVRYLYNERTTDMDKLLVILGDLTRRFNIRMVATEEIAFQKSLAKEYRRRALSLGLRIPWVEVPRSRRTGKIARWLNLQPLIQRGDFMIMQGLECSSILIDQLTSLTPDHLPDYDDLLDAVTDCYMLSFQASSFQPEGMPDDCAEAIFSKEFGPLTTGKRAARTYIGSGRGRWY